MKQLLVIPACALLVALAACSDVGNSGSAGLADGANVGVSTSSADGGMLQPGPDLRWDQWRSENSN